MAESKQKQDKKGVVLLIVIGTVFVVIFLASVVLNIITSHSRLTHHQVSRIQAYYASMAGVNYALEKLRTGAWVAGRDCTTAPGCSPELDLSNDFKPASINSVSIVIIKPGDTGCLGNNACVSVTADYTYTAP